MAQDRSKADRFKALTAIDLQEWAGTKIYSRGQSYQRGRRVQELARTPDGALVAWVLGSDRYATWVDIDEAGPESSCSCPYGMSCKHAVAVVIEYAEKLKHNSPVPTTTEQDRRLALAGVADEDDDWDEEEDWDEQDAGDSATTVGKTKGSLRSFLEQQTKERLVELVEELAERYPQVRDALKYRRNLASGRLPELITAVRQEIAAASAKVGWRNDWDDDGYTPDYTRVRDYLAAMLAEGHADAVVELGEELLESGKNQVEMSHDEGETAGEIIECLNIVFQALAQSTRPAAERMLWAIDAELGDDFDLTQGSIVFWAQEFPAADWNIVADDLARRLEADAPLGKLEFSSTYRRDRLSNRLIKALSQAGREDGIIPLAEREAERTHSFVRLVNLLRQAGRTAEAEQWIYRGIAATQQQWPGVASQLRGILRELRQASDDRPFVAALQAEEFFNEPSMRTFLMLQQAAEQAGVWPAVRSAVMRYLETGARPPAARHPAAWPLPEINLPPHPSPRQLTFPLIDMLIAVAIAERQPDQVLRWYDQRQARPHGLGGV